jgi:hypothetical protein
MQLLLLLCFWLLPAVIFAQTTVAGRVVDAQSGDGLPGVTILQTGTTNGVSSEHDGYFSFTVPGKTDSVALTISSIGYYTQRVRVAGGSNTTLRLSVDLKTSQLGCCCFVPAKLVFSLVSGLRYAPFGASVLLDGGRFIRVPLTVTARYQTNFARNHALTLGLDLPPIRRYRINLTETLEYQQLRTPATQTWFDSYTGVVGLNAGSIGGLRLPTFLLGAGYAQWRPASTETAATKSGYGYTAGVRFNVLPYPFNLYGTVQASRWPDAWQWRGQLSHGFPKNLQAGVSLNQLGQYSEFSVNLTRSFY